MKKFCLYTMRRQKTVPNFLSCDQKICLLFLLSSTSSLRIQEDDVQLLHISESQASFTSYFSWLVHTPNYMITENKLGHLQDVVSCCWWRNLPFWIFLYMKWLHIKLKYNTYCIRQLAILILQTTCICIWLDGTQASRNKHSIEYTNQCKNLRLVMFNVWGCGLLYLTLSSGMSCI